MKIYYNSGARMGYGFARVFCLLLICLTLSLLKTAAQPGMLTPLSISVQELNTEQRIRYDKALALGIYSGYQFVHVEPVASAQQNGRIAVSFAQAPCSTAYFSATDVAYFGDDDNYYWYGSLAYIDSSSACARGSAMLLARNGEHFGQIQVEDKAFELIELSGGVQLLAGLDSAVQAAASCGTTGSGTARNAEGMEPDGSSLCNVRVLVLYTPAAAAAEPSIDNRIHLSIAQVQQALRNSNVAHFNLNIVHAGSQMVDYTEEHYVYDPVSMSKSGGTFLDVDNMTPYGPRSISSIVNSARYAWQADVVLLLTRGSGGDNVAGRAYGIQSADYPYAALQSRYASSAGYTFAHELGHIFGARHQDDEDAASQDNTPSIAHAHRFAYSSTTGRSFWKKTRYHTGRTIVYGASAGNAEVQLHYSNPTADHEATPTGTIVSSYGRRYAAKQFNIVACEVSGYYAGEPGNFFGGQIRGISRLCAGRSGTLYSKVFGAAPGAAGLCSYAWRQSTDGINFGPVLATSQNLVFTMPALPRLFFKVLITELSSGRRIEEDWSVGLETSPMKCAADAARTAQQEQAASSSHRLLSVYPIPAQDQINIRYELQQAAGMEVSLYDYTGRFVQTLYRGQGRQGSNSLHLKLGAVAGGLYFIRFTADGYSSTQKLMINP